MWWFNLLAGLASVVGLMLSLLALQSAGEAKRRVAAFERHEDAMGALRDLLKCQSIVRELQRSTAAVRPRYRCDALAEALGRLDGRRVGLSETERNGLTRFRRQLHRGGVVNDPLTAAGLRALGALLATMENRLTTVARKEAQP